MTVCAVFQLGRDEAEYEVFFQKIEEISEGNFRQIMDGCILMDAILTPRAIRQRLLPCLFPDDRLFLCNFGEECGGQLPPKSRDWLKKNVFDKALPQQVKEQIKRVEKDR